MPNNLDAGTQRCKIVELVTVSYHDPVLGRRNPIPQQAQLHLQSAGSQVTGTPKLATRMGALQQ